MKKHYIKYLMIWTNPKTGVEMRMPWKSRYKTEKARDEAIKNFEKKGYKILTVGEEGSWKYTEIKNVIHCFNQD